MGLGLPSFNILIRIVINLVEILILSACLTKSNSSKSPLAGRVRDVMGCAIILLALRICMLFTTSVSAGYVIFSAFAIAQLFYYMNLAAFLSSMAGMSSPKWVRYGFYALMGLDSISFIIGYFTKHTVAYEIVDGVALVTHGIGYYVHTLIKVSILCYIVIQSARKMSKTHFIYWQRYVFFSLFIGLALVLDITKLGTFNVLKYPTTTLFVATMILYLLTCVFHSDLLRASMFSAVFNSLPAFTFLVDNAGEVVLVNNSAKEFFGITELDFSKVKSEILNLVDPNDSVDVGNTYTTRYFKGEKQYYLRLEYKRLTHKGKFAGEIYGFTDVTEAAERFIVTNRKAHFDSFTDVYNNEWLCACIDKELENNPSREYFLVGSDIRDFKVFNDVFGKEAGDEVILHSAKILRDLYESGDITYYGRIYADRFGMLVPKEKYNENNIVNKFMEIDHPFKDRYYHLNIHFGVYPTSVESGLSAKVMFDRAYVALDAIKNEANIKVYHYNIVMRDEKIWEQTISSSIQRAIEERQLRIVVQPQVDRDEHVIGGEALVRWRHPENGEISPGEFIPILEKTGLVTTADMYVWEESCRLLARWDKMGYKDYYVSVNISAVDFMFTDIYSIFTGLVEKYNVSPQNLKLEITESAMMTDVLERIVLIKRLETYGFSVELDDFGSGYSSLNMLKEIPVDVIKMDMKFLYNYNDDSTSNSRKVIGHIIQMAKDLHMQIVAEGVETREQLGFLQDAGCDVFQGYLFSKPIEVSDFEKNEGIVADQAALDA